MVTATTAAEFKNFVNQAAALTVQVKGTIDLRPLDGANGRVFTQSNKTIVGIGDAPTVIGNLNISGVSNVIVQNLNWTNPQDGADGLTIWNGDNVWVDHVSFVDCGDGMCDINNGSDNVTVSWSKFSYVNRTTHKFTMIADGTSAEQAHITLHHNWWAEGCDQRMPASSYAFVHAYANYFSSTGNYYAQNARTNTQMLSENNYFKSVNNPVTVSTGTTGLIRTAGNIYDNTTGTIYSGNDIVFTPWYAYTLDSTVDVPALVMANAGAHSTTPTIAAPVAAATTPVTGTTAALSVLGADDGGEARLAYGWAATGPGTVTFSVNGVNAAKNITATFTKPGDYLFTATVTDATGLTTTSSLNVAVKQTATNLAISPTSATLNTGASHQFTALAFDQFGDVMNTQPSFAWSVLSGSGTISGAGLYTAPGAAGSAVVKVTTGGVSGTANVSVIATAPNAPSNLKAAVASSSQIGLSWSDNSNNETSFRIERATNSAFTAGFVSTTVAAGTTSRNVTGLSPNTVYYFRVRAQNAAANSSYTAVTSARTKVATITYQAENATRGGGTTIDSNWSGYRGTGFANLPTKNGYIEFGVNAAVAGTYMLTFRYALGASTARNVSMQVNGTTVSGGLTFTGTNAWTTWSTASVTLNLNSGSNRVRLTSIGQDSGNIDELTVAPI